MPMLAYEQFGSVSYMTSVNGVMATLEALNLVAHQVSIVHFILLNNFVPCFKDRDEQNVFARRAKA